MNPIKLNNVTVVILVFNAEKTIDYLLGSIKAQTCKVKDVICIDSGSTDSTLEKIKSAGCTYKVINHFEFNHGTTRRYASSLIDADFYIFMTQDAIPATTDAFAKLLVAFQNEKVGCAYGRQLPHKDADILATHARLFNYPDQSSLKSYADKDKYGIKTCFNSDSFAAYRKTALNDIGGFPENINFGEDMWVAAKMLLKGWLIAYQADAQVYHSHNYSFLQEFKRYFEIGKFHAQNFWILEKFRGPQSEGMKFVKSEIKFCIAKHKYSTAITSLLHSIAKFVGYELGKKCYFNKDN